MNVFTWSGLLTENNKEFFVSGSSVSVGSFDGPHKGHFLIFRQVLEDSKTNGTKSGIITFERPVSSIKQKENYKGDISTLDERLNIFESLGFDFTIVIHFDETFKQMEGNQFFLLLKEKINLKFIAEGEDFHCGKNGSFEKTQIQKFCTQNDIRSNFVPLLKENGKRISSTMIRNLIFEKNTKKAMELLGLSVD